MLILASAYYGRVHNKLRIGILETQYEWSGSSKAREICVHSHIIIGIYRAGLFWLQAVQRHPSVFPQCFSKVERSRGRPQLDLGAIRYVSN